MLMFCFHYLIFGMISLFKYEIENKYKGQDLGSVGGGGWGVLTILRFQKLSHSACLMRWRVIVQES